MGGFLPVWFLLVTGLLFGCVHPAGPSTPDPVGVPATKTVLLISIDGLRWDYLKRYQPPHLLALAQKGVRAEGLVPVFPSKTFPNHYSIVTGLYPGEHGIIGNKFYDADFDATYSLADREAVADGRWYGGEPIWVTAQKQGLRAYCFFWPGSEAAIQGVRPALYKDYDEGISHADRVATVVSWLAADPQSRPHFASLYFSAVDKAGHKFGPLSPQTRDALLDVDHAIGRLLQEVASRGLEGQVDIVVVSDHGMMATAQAQPVFVPELWRPAEVDRQIINSTMVFLWPKDPVALQKRLRARGQAFGAGFDTYLADQVPERYHLKGSQRLSPVFLVARPGFVFEPQARPAGVWRGKPGGTHGYDNAFSDMHGLFVAAGPSFAAGQVVPAFENIHIYGLLSRLLGIKPAANHSQKQVIDSLLRRP